MFREGFSFLGILFFFSVFVLTRAQGNEENIFAGKPRFIPGSGHSNLTFKDDEQQWVAAFTCKFSGAEPLSISWHYNGLRLTPASLDSVFEVHQNIGKLTTESTLIVKEFSSQLDLQFSCLAVNPFGYGYHDLWLAAPPLVTYKASSDLLEPGDTVTANCTSYPDSKLFWRLPGVASLRNDSSVTVHTDEVSTVSIITLTLTDADNGAEFQCCAIGNNPRKRASPLCASFIVKESQPLTVSYASNCSQNAASPTENCNLRCTFYSNPPPMNITPSWHFCPSPPPELDVECTDVSDGVSTVISEEGYPVTDHHMLSSDIKYGSYICRAIDEDGSNVEHTFVIDGDQASCNSVNISQLNHSDSSAASLQCTFVANPITKAYWTSNGVGETIGSMIIDQDKDQYDVDVVSGNHGISTITLNINPFTADEVAHYTCVIENSMSSIHSHALLLEKMPDFTDFELRVTPENISDQTVVRVSCSINSDVAPENILWRVLTEFESQYEIISTMESDNNVHSSSVQFTANWINDIIRVKCAISFATAPFVPLIQSREFQIHYEPQIFEISNCNPEAFDGSDGGCRLSCSSQQDGRFSFEKLQWIYFGVNESQSVALDGQLMSKPTPHRITTSQFLSDFSAGFYQCSFDYKSNESGQMIRVRHNFKIEPDGLGVALNGDCTSSRECLALDSGCINGKCSCKENFTAYGETACLKAVPYGEECISDEQCAQATEKAICYGEKRHCQCPKEAVHISLPNHRCIFSVKLGGKCVLDDDCQLFKNFTRCLNLTCNCSESYKFDENKTECILHEESIVVHDPEKVSTGSVIGILLLVMIVVGVAAAVICTSVKKYRKKQRRLKAKQAANINLQDVGPGAIGSDRLNSNDTNYWYNPHRPVKLNVSSTSRAS